MKTKMSLLNRMLLPFAPQTACKREAWTQYARGFYSAADTGRRSAGWTAQNVSGEQTNQGERDIIRARARDLERNGDILTSEVLAFERNVVGTGMVLQAKVLAAGGSEDEALNTEIERCWREWCKPQNCEMTGRFSLSEVESMCLRRRVVDGGILILKVLDGGCFKLQLLEVDDLDTSVQVWGDNRVVGGIEVDCYRKPVAYHIKQYDSWGFSVKSVRVDAERVVSLPYLTRPSQVREISPTAPSLCRIDDVNELIDASVEKERVLSHLSVVVEKANGTLTGNSMMGLGRGFGASGSTTPAAPDEPPSEILDQGTVTYLNPGESLKTVAPAGTSSIVDPMIRTTQRLAGGSIGLSYEAVSRDMSQVNYSSARQGLLEDQKTYKPLQKYLIDHFLDAIYPEWLETEVLSGRLSFPDFFQNREKYLPHVWISSGWDWIDPLREANANRIALETNQTTLQEICASKGKDWRDVVAQRNVELQIIKENSSHDKAAGEPENPSESEATSAAADVAAEGQSIQSVSLNGAQLDSLIAIVTMVVSGGFPYESAIALLISAFPFDAETAKKILNQGKQMKTGGNANEPKKEE